MELQQQKAQTQIESTYLGLFQVANMRDATGAWYPQGNPVRAPGALAPRRPSSMLLKSINLRLYDSREVIR